jgi:phosphate-selective porin OprO/OprP
VYVNCKALFVTGIATLFLSQPGSAQETTPQPAAKAENADKTKEEASGNATKRGWRLSWENRPSVRYGDLVRIDLRARFAGDMRGSGAALEKSDTSRLDIARRRVGVTGVIADVADFQIERELANARAWRDVYVNYRGFDNVDIQAGQFKLPFGLDENTSSANLDFVYRSRAAAFSPGRDPGVMAHGRVRALRYEVGVFARDGDNARGNDTLRVSGSWTAAGRLVLQPFRSSKSVMEDFQAGAAYTSSDVPAGLADLRGDTTLAQPFFRPEFAVQGTRRRVGLEMRWRPGPFSLQSEFVRLSSERLGQSIEETDLPPLVANAWYIHGTWLATGERKTKGADEPRRPLFGGGFGSVELAARVEAVRLSSIGTGFPSTGPRAETILPHRDRSVTLGVSWSPNRWVRVQANLVRDTISIPAGAAGASDSLIDGPSSSFWSRVLRFRFAM